MAGAHRYFSRHHLVAARVPIDLRGGQFSRGDFRADFDSVYDLDLGVARAMPVQELKCLLGVERQHWETCEARSRLDVKWEVESGKKLIASGRVAGEQDPTQWDGSSIRRLGWFAAKKGVNYRVLITSIRDASSGLAPARPQLVVRTVKSALPDDSYSKWAFFRRLGKWLAGCGLFLFGLLVLGLVFKRQMKDR